MTEERRRFRPGSLVPLGLAALPLAWLLEMPAVAAGGVGCMAVGIGWGVASADKRTQTTNTTALTEQLLALLGPGSTVSRHRDQVKIDYGAAFRDYESSQRQAVERMVNTRLDGRWRVEWDTTHTRATAHKRPPMPKKLDRPLPGPAAKADEFPLGVDENGRVRSWQPRVTPHLLISGATGGGKTVTISGLITEATARGWEVRIVDGKGTTLRGFRSWPGVTRTGYGDADAMAPILLDTETETRRRFNSDAEVDELRPLLLVIDEAAEMTTSLASDWRSNKPKGGGASHPAIDSWRSIARLGREARVHLVFGIQQAAASFFQGTEARDNFHARLALGPTTEQSADMMFGRTWVGRDVPTTAKGRATYAVQGDEYPTEIQTYYSPELRKTGGPVDPADTKAHDLWVSAARVACPSPRAETPVVYVSAHQAQPGRTYLVDGDRFGPLTREPDPVVGAEDTEVEWTSAKGTLALDGDTVVEEIHDQDED